MTQLKLTWTHFVQFLAARVVSFVLPLRVEKPNVNLTLWSITHCVLCVWKLLNLHLLTHCTCLRLYRKHTEALHQAAAFLFRIKMRHKSGVNLTNWSIISFVHRNYWRLSSLPFSQKAAGDSWVSSGGWWRMSSWLQQLVCLSLCLFVSPLRTVSCGQQHHFIWQLQSDSTSQIFFFFLCLSAAIFSVPRCQSANVFYPLSIINSRTLSPSPRLYYRPLCVWMWMFFRSPTGTLRLAVWLVTWLLPATAG